MKVKTDFIGFLFAITFTTVLSLIWLIPIPCQAKEVVYPVPVYDDQELERVREWEKAWVGKKITPENIDGVKEFIPENYYNVLKDSATWGVVTFDIVPYRRVLPSPGDLKFTKMYAGTCVVGEDGALKNYISGMPFPNAKTGLEIMFNYDNKNMGDNTYAYQDAWVIDGKRKYDRKLIIEGYGLYFSGRREVDPTPEITPNTKQMYRGGHSLYVEPASLRGNRSLNITWKDRSRDYGSWSFSSATRRISRRSTAQRQDAVGGADITLDDNFGYSWFISAQTYKLLGTKEILTARHQDFDYLKQGHTEGYCLMSNIQAERMKMYVLEAIHKDPNYIYSKQFYYIDPETWWILYADKYDRQGNLWKIFVLPQYILTSVFNGAEIGIPCAMQIIDVQRIHGTSGPVDMTTGVVGQFHRPNFYIPRALQKWGY